MEKMYSVAETAQILDLCIDSVRRHLRAGKLPGVRVGRAWRIPESRLSSYMGVASPPASSAPDLLSSTYSRESNSRRYPAPRAQNEVVWALLGTGAARDEVLELARRAAAGAELTPEAARRLLLELNELLHQY